MNPPRWANKDRFLVALVSIAATGGTAILLACGLLPYELPVAPLPLSTSGFSVCLATITVAAVSLFRRGKHSAAVIAIAVAGMLLYFSFLDLYGKHWTPWTDEPHRHQLWELGHVH